MADQMLQVLSEGDVVHVVLSRLERGNALDAALVEELLAAVKRAEDGQVRLFVISGAGRNLCTGFDFTGIEEETDETLAYRFLRLEMLLQAVYYAPYDTLAFAHGRVFGAGADLVNACSRRVAAPDSSFRMPGLAFGIVLGTRRFLSTVGERGRNLLAEGRTFTAQEALDMGFVEHLAEPQHWAALIENTVTRLTALPRDSLARLNEVARRRDEGADADMAALARSVARPGLKQRMQDYRAGLERQRAR